MSIAPFTNRHNFTETGDHGTPAASVALDRGAVVLAGGQSRRMGGVDKGLMDLAGRPMITYVLQSVAPLVQQCIVIANRNHDAYSSVVETLSASCPSLVQKQPSVMSDTLAGYQGPLAGLYTALNVLDARYVLMCPCDSPFVEAALLERLFEACRELDADVAVAHDGQRLQPVFLVAQQRTQESLRDFLDAGERKIDRWFETLHTEPVDTTRYARAFRNINTEEERLQAQGLLDT